MRFTHSSRLLVLALALSVLTASCGDGDAPPADAGRDAGGSLDLGRVDGGPIDGGDRDGGGPMDGGDRDGGGPTDAGVDGGAPLDGGPFDAGMCGAAFPTFDRGCEINADCSVVLHQVDCCGTNVALGIRFDGVSSFDTRETACRALFPVCDCVSQPTAADDGTVDDGIRPVRSECVGGNCRSTYAPVADCSSGGALACVGGEVCCYPCGIPGCASVCQPPCTPGSPGCAGGGCPLFP